MSPHGCQTWKSARWPSATGACHGSVQTCSAARHLGPAGPDHDAPNDSQMILSFTELPPTVACLGQLGTNGSMASLSSILSAPKAGATPHRSLEVQMLDATPRLMTGSLSL